MPPTTTRARWITDVPDLSARLNDVPNYLNVAQVSEATGFSPNTILDLLSRDPITQPQNPQGKLSRPAARIGTVPLYSKKQVADCVRLDKARGGLHLGGTRTPLPKLSATESDRLGHLSIMDIAELAPMHEQSVRKLIRRDSTFPPAIALRERDEDSHSGVPFVVRGNVAVRRWLAEHGYDVDVPEGTDETQETESTQAV